ncbi:hypothetical protein [Rhodococcus jostii]|uniref:hypothetical protein n=1 Tax=Rhodococcus jostii TaxID=132919 RepID=UPI003640BC64
MTVDHTARTRRRASIRKLLYTPLAVGILAGAVCAGTGIGAAAPAVDAVAESTTTPAPSAPPANEWVLANETASPIYGLWSENRGDATSKVETDSDHPLEPGGTASRTNLDETAGHLTYWWAHVCYNHRWRNLNAGRSGPYLTDRMELKADGPHLAVEFFATGDLHERNGRAVLEDNPYEAPC